MPHLPEPATTIADELAAMKRIAAVLDRLDPAAQGRVLQWLVDRYEPSHDVAAALQDVTR